MKFFLIGFMGAGKTTIGKYAASHNALHFLDLDEYIEKREGREVRDIFREMGEEYFRQVEKRALEEVCAIDGLDMLVSCGGGTPCFFDNMEVMNAHGHTIYLDMGAARLTDRLRNSKEKRPLLNAIEGDLQHWVHKKLVERATFYSQSQTIVAEDDCNKKFVAELVGKLTGNVAAL
ncbi:MAG: shikimate kinase [Bacteroidia bacterium]